MISRSARYVAAFLFIAALAFANVALAQSQDYKAAVSAVTAPSEIAAPVRALLSPASISVSGPAGPFCEIWVRTSIPTAAQPSTALGVNYGQMIDGEIVGAIHFDAAAKDFRNQSVKPGTYILRYGLQPVDGNHQGVSDFRDYLLLTPAGQDSSAANLAVNDMYVLSRKSTTTGHPSVWSLVPADSAPASIPGAKQDTSEDTWTVYFKAALGSSPITIGLIISGHATAP